MKSQGKTPKEIWANWDAEYAQRMGLKDSTTEILNTILAGAETTEEALRSAITDQVRLATGDRRAPVDPLEHAERLQDFTRAPGRSTKVTVR